MTFLYKFYTQSFFQDNDAPKAYKVIDIFQPNGYSMKYEH